MDNATYLSLLFKLILLGRLSNNLCDREVLLLSKFMNSVPAL